LDFLLIVHKKYEKNLFLEYVIDNYSAHVLFYHTSDLESMSLDKIVKYIHQMKPKYIVVDEYKFLYQPLQTMISKQLFLIKLDNRKIEFYEDKVSLILFNRYEVLTLKKLYPDSFNEVYCFEDFQVNYDKIDRTFLFIFQRTTAMDEFFNSYPVEIQKKLFKKIQSFFVNLEEYSFDYALNILVRFSTEVKDNLAILYDSLEDYANSLSELVEIKEQNYKVSIHTLKCDFLPYKYTSHTTRNNNLSELLYTNKIIVLPKYESSQIEKLINDVCEALFLGSYVFLHETNKIFIEYFSFKNIGFYKSFSQIPKLLGNVKLNPQEIRNNKRLILQFKNTQSMSVEKSFKVFGIEKDNYLVYIKPYIFKDNYKLLNISFDDQKQFYLSNFISLTLGYPEGMEVKNITLSNKRKLTEELSREQAEKICFFDRKNIKFDESKYLLESDIYYYSCDLEDFDINRVQRDNETYVTSSLYLLEYFQSNNLQCLLETSYNDYSIKGMPSKEIATYLYMYDNEKEYKRIYENELISEVSKQKFSEYIAEQALADYSVLHDMIDDQEIKSLFNFNNVAYSTFVNNIIANHLNTELSLLSSPVNSLDIYANQIFLYSIMDNVKAFCNYKYDLENIIDFLNTIGEYKFFIYPPILDNYNLSLLLTVIVSLKRTYVILPESFKNGIVKMGLNSDIFSFYSSNTDIVNIYVSLKEDVLRNKAIENYLSAINMKKT